MKLCLQHWIVSSLIFGCTQTAFGTQENTLSQMMTRIVQIRAEVEEKSRNLETAHTAEKGELDALLASRHDLQGQLEKQKLRKLQAKEKIKHLQAQTIQKHKPTDKEISSVVEMIDVCQKWVQSSLPFRLEARLTELGRLRTRLLSANENPELIAVDIIIWLEGELKLAQTLEYRIMDIPINNAVEKAEIVRLGLAQMFSQSPSGKLGYYQFINDKWDWIELTNSKSIDSVKRLFTYYKQKKNSGYFELPLTNTKETL